MLHEIRGICSTRNFPELSPQTDSLFFINHVCKNNLVFEIEHTFYYAIVMFNIKIPECL